MNPLTERLVAAGAGIAAAGVVLQRPWLHIGATRSERHAPLPGDEFVVHALVEGTRAISVNAPPQAVWPWLAQMGHGRAGWYGYDLWDNAGAASADRLLPDIKPLAVGDIIADAVGPFGFQVVRLDPGQAVVFRSTIHPITGKRVDPSRQPRTPYIDFTWAFALRSQPNGGTRLLVRVRYNHSSLRWVALAVDAYEAVDAVFTHKMLRGIRDRAEGHTSASSAASDIGGDVPMASETPMQDDGADGAHWKERPWTWRSLWTVSATPSPSVGSSATPTRRTASR